MARRADFDVFYEKFRPITRIEDDTILWETYIPDITDVARTIRERGEEYVWTLVDGGNGKLYLCPGMHYIGRLNYVICENDWQQGQRDYLY